MSDELFNAMNSLFNYAEHPGGLLCGIRGHVVKCHGAASAKSFAAGIRYAADLAGRDVSGNIARFFS